LSAHFGEVVVVEFMTTWCGVCKRQHEELTDLHEAFEDVIIVTVEVDVNLKEEDFQGWAQEKGFDWTVGHSPKKGWDYRVTGVPTVIVVDKEGIIRHRTYYTSFEELSALVEKYQ
jgi:thiol-disulfide isomerase/thioredoxin